jgi:hypothetical protein
MLTLTVQGSRRVSVGEARTLETTQYGVMEGPNEQFPSLPISLASGSLLDATSAWNVVIRSRGMFTL